MIATLSLLCALVPIAHQYKILALAPYDGKSHFDVFEPFFQALSDKGHNLTLITYSTSNISDKIKTYWLEKPEVTNVLSLQHPNAGSQIVIPIVLEQMAREYCGYGLQTAAFRRFLRENEDVEFDLILAELFVSDCFLGLANKFKAPVIGLSSCAALPWQGKWFGAQPNPAYVQNLFEGFSTPMTFWHRLENTLSHIYANVWYELFIGKIGNEWSKKFIGFEAADPHNTSLFLVNTHYTLTGVQPLTPNIIEVGGLHVQNRKPQKLPRHLEDWITNAEAGVIYFSLGSMIKSETFPGKQRSNFLRAFARFPQRILWKWENGTLADKPGNVMVDKWMPQYEILCHPNVKLFLSHGGLLGTIEAAHCGKPLVVMPQFGDQKHNAYAMETNGVGVLLHLQTATEEQIVEAIKKALQPKTIQNAKDLRDKFKDRPLSPMDTAIYWVEHVARHKGGQHMRSQAINMPFYQLYLLDVFGFIIFIIFLLLFVLYKTSRLILDLSKAKKIYKQKST